MDGLEIIKIKHKHTQGPWFVNKAPSGNYFIYPDSADDADAICGIKHYGNGLANAILISSAPDLLNALEVLAKTAKSFGIPTDAADAAIKRAKRDTISTM